MHNAIIGGPSFTKKKAKSAKNDRLLGFKRGSTVSLP